MSAHIIKLVMSCTELMTAGFKINGPKENPSLNRKPCSGSRFLEVRIPYPVFARPRLNQHNGQRPPPAARPLPLLPHHLGFSASSSQIQVSGCVPIEWQLAIVPLASSLIRYLLELDDITREKISSLIEKNKVLLFMKGKQDIGNISYHMVCNLIFECREQSISTMRLLEHCLSYSRYAKCCLRDGGCSCRPEHPPRYQGLQLMAHHSTVICQWGIHRWLRYYDGALSIG